MMQPDAVDDNARRQRILGIDDPLRQRQSATRRVTVGRQKRRLPRDKHRGQTRLSGEPYLSHPLAVADLLAENLPNARKLVLPDCGHASPLERPEAFNEALIGFLREVSIRSP
jgi:pimeloyl-ACP methyl ester carboxylesterase